MATNEGWKETRVKGQVCVEEKEGLQNVKLAYVVLVVMWSICWTSPANVTGVCSLAYVNSQQF